MLPFKGRIDGDSGQVQVGVHGQRSDGDFLDALERRPRDLLCGQQDGTFDTLHRLIGPEHEPEVLRASVGDDMVVP